jgi:uncharacterized protein (DUF1800 family)
MKRTLGSLLAASMTALVAACGGGSTEESSAPVAQAAAISPESSSQLSSTAGPTTRNDAARFLIQATYGANDAAIDDLLARGYDGWFDAQFATASMDSHWAYVVERKGPPGCNPCDAAYVNGVMESFWRQAVLGPDQLRQRMTLALSELFVVSAANNDVIGSSPQALASYLDMLSRNAFGNYRTVLEQVATHPTMGTYLSHMRNMKEDPATGRLPDENFAREVMQLFSIGLWQLNPDGTRKKDSAGKDIPTYVQSDVMGMAKVFTGWSWGGGSDTDERWNGWNNTQNWKEQMQPYERYHSTSEKRFLGTVIPANTKARDSLKIALDTLFNHPNVGPMVANHLIQRFVTSNPTPAYVGRVAAKFNDNGSGVRGDMKAVLEAVLMDRAARSADQKRQRFGKLREPMVRYANFMRAFDVKAQSGYYRIWNLEDPVSSLGQNPLRAPSVFNFFRPDYTPPGALSMSKTRAPEFQITHETTVTGYANFVTWKAERETVWWRDNVQKQYSSVRDYLAASYAPELALVNDPAALVDRVNTLLAGGMVDATNRQAIIDAVARVPASANAGNTRVATAVALTMLTPEFIVQK